MADNLKIAIHPQQLEVIVALLSMNRLSGWASGR